LNIEADAPRLGLRIRDAPVFDVYATPRLPTGVDSWLPESFAPVLEQLALFDWQPRGPRPPRDAHASDEERWEVCRWCQEHYGHKHKKPVHQSPWQGVRAAFVLSTSDYLLGDLTGQSLPDLTQFSFNEYESADTDQDSGIDIAASLYLDGQATESFAKFMNETGQTLTRVKSSVQGYQWGFLTRALTLLWHACLFDGYEQLLQNVYVVEALLGDKGPSITARLGRRIAVLLCPPGSSRKAEEREFGVVYDLRSRQVHGDQLPAEGLEWHLANARRFARGSCLWFVNFLSKVLLHESEGRPLAWAPEREDILTAIDTDRPTRGRLVEFFAAMQNDLPGHG
jgi:hypothetical protein